MKMKTDKKLNKKVVIVVGIIFLGLITIIIYQSYALFKTNKKMNFINAKVGEFGQTADIIVNIYVDNVKQEEFPDKSEYVFDEMTCTDSGVAIFDETAWSLKINDISGPTKCDVYFKKGPIDCIREGVSVLKECILASNEVKEGTLNHKNAFTQDEIGLWKINNTDGVTAGLTYFFRGDHSLNNNVIFAGFQWKIIRIDSSNNIRMIYNGICADENCVINKNGAETLVKSIGFFAGSWRTYPIYDGSLVKTHNQNWYTSNLTDYDSYIVDAGYCSNGDATQTTYYNYYRIEENYAPTYLCAKNYYYTVSNNEGNKLNTRKVGLLTIDEFVFAGKSDNFLSNDQTYWTMSPRHYSYYTEYDWEGYPYIIRGNSFDSRRVDIASGLRPVIALTPAVQITKGNGSVEKPYVIKID